MGARLLDVGIGTGKSLTANEALLRERDLRVVGIDIDVDYLRRCRERVARMDLEDRIEVHHVSVYAFDEVGFDAVYFGASFMLLPDPVAALRHVATLLRPGGRVWFTQTFEEKRNPFFEKAKPLLHRVTTIHFGKVTYEADFLQTLERAGYVVDQHLRLGGGPQRSWRLVSAAPASLG